MAKRGTSERDNGELEFTRAAWDAIGDAQESYGLEYVTLLSFDQQRGVLRVELAFWDNDLSALDCQPVKLVNTWPNANGSSWGAFYFQQVNKLCQMAAAWYADRYPLGRPSTK